MSILTKRAVFFGTALKAMPNACIQSVTTFSTIANRFSTAYKPAPQGSQTDGEGKYIEYMSGVRGFVTDTAILQGTVKATEMEEKLSEMAKEAMDTAWDSAKNTTQKVEDTLVAEADENVVDTSEYRAIEDITHRADDGHDHPRDDRIKL
ncbi:uncharacterized protein LOC112488976 [Ziziphus jujuba]|uniref:Uncharacterized protein LOC112488976 n=1 Tax=Ziziphus jujuba TaxID=326968 RepID=A0A6P6G3Q0_ZIZJJ|nr:uncharacterized protein LOC112488976 [Ziziphus jujuba]